MLQETLERIHPLFPKERILIVLDEGHLQVAKEQLSGFLDSNFVVEPEGRDTAPCIGLASIRLDALDPDAIAAVIPADHYIPRKDHGRFLKALEKGIEFLRREDRIVTLGIPPVRPETGYGYIERGREIENGTFEVARFIEKPDSRLAREYLSAGNFYWNSGMFMWRNKTILSLFSRFLPDHFAVLQRMRAALGGEEEKRVIQREFPHLPKISIDYGILEHAPGVVMIPTNFQWDDIGTWLALERVKETDNRGNLTFGPHICLDTTNTLVYADDKLVATMGVSGLVVVSSQAGVLVCRKDACADLKRLVKEIGKEATGAQRRKSSE
jgi:mannose-1-phosphate guanylyltransferase